MNILLVYLSPNGTTAKISRALGERLSQDGHTVTSLDIGKPANRNPRDLSPQIFDGMDVIGIGSPLFHMRILEPLDHYLAAILPGLRQPVRAFIYLTYGGVTTGKAFLNTANLLKRFRIPVVGGMKVWAPHFYKKVEYPDPSALKTIDEFCTGLSQNQFREIPWDEVRRMFSYQTWKVNVIYPLTHWIGKLRELPIRIDHEKCIQCKRCVNECPAGALEMSGVVHYHREKCIFCYHCTTVCGRHAVICPTEKVDEALQTNIKIIGKEQPVNAVYL